MWSQTKSGTTRKPDAVMPHKRQSHTRKSSRRSRSQHLASPPANSFRSPVELVPARRTGDGLRFAVFLLVMPQVGAGGRHVLALVTHVLDVVMIALDVALQLVACYRPECALVALEWPVTCSEQKTQSQTDTTEELRCCPLFLEELCSSHTHIHTPNPTHHRPFKTSPEP